jgi:glutamate racemase
MTGIFDSGSGGLFAARILKRLVPDEKLMLLCDRENAPYGTRKRSEIIRLAESNVKRLHAAGCERILIACCTASAVHKSLAENLGKISIPILIPTAERAAGATRSGRVAVIATEATVRSHLFGESLASCGVESTELAAQELVRMVDDGKGRLGEDSRAYLGNLARKIKDTGADTLVLGCTHFHAARAALEGAFYELKKEIYIVSSAEVGAEVARDEIYAARAAKGKEKEKWESTEETGLTMPLPKSLLSRSATSESLR